MRKSEYIINNEIDEYDNIDNIEINEYPHKKNLN
mgnify:CR=1 FL=1